MHDETVTKRIMSEERIAARFRHPNIISILDVNVSNGVPYIAMEYVPGGVLDTARIKSLELNEKLSIIVQLADALAFLHSQNFIHRDIKPGNILFREDNTAVLTDFGIARDKSAKSSMTQTGYIVGTPHYMSPEQARGRELDARSDLYSLGVLMFRILTTRLPFTADNPILICNMHLTAEVPDLPPELAKFDPIVKKLMAKSPDDRHQNANEFIDDLISVTGSETAQLLKRSVQGVALQAVSTEDRSSGISTAVQASPIDLKTKIQADIQATNLMRKKPRDAKRASARRKSRSAKHPKKGLPRKSNGVIKKHSTLILSSLIGILFIGTAVIVAIKFFDPFQSKTRESVESTPSEVGKSTAQREAISPGDTEKANAAQRDIESLLAKGRRALRAEVYVRPANRSAYYYFRAVLQADPGNEEALDGLQSTAHVMLDLAEKALQSGDKDTAAQLLRDIRKINSGDQNRIARLESRIAASTPDSAEQNRRAEQERLARQKRSDEQERSEEQERSAEQDHSRQKERAAEAARAAERQLIASLLVRGHAKTQTPFVINEASSPSGEFRKVLELDPTNAEAIAGLDRFSATLLGMAESFAQRRDTESLRTALTELQLAGRTDPGKLLKLEQEYEQLMTAPAPAPAPSAADSEILALLASARSYLAEDQLTQPADANAVSEFRKVLALDEGNAEALAGLQQVGERYLKLALGQISRGNWQTAEKYWQRSNEFAPGLEGAGSVRDQIDENSHLQQVQRTPPPTSRPTSRQSTNTTPNAPPANFDVYSLPNVNLAGNESAEYLYGMAQSAMKSDKMRAYALYKQALRVDPDFSPARSRLESGARSSVNEAKRYIREGDLWAARENLAIAIALDASYSKLESVRREYLTARDRLLYSSTAADQSDSLTELRIRSLLTEAKNQHSRFRANTSNHATASNAKNYYTQALNLRSDNPAAREGLSSLFNELIRMSQLALAEAQMAEALWSLGLASEIKPNHPDVQALEAQLN